MDINTIMQLVGSLGAPIVFSFCLLRMMKDNSEKHEAEVKMMNEQHSNDIKDITSTINSNNVEVIKKLGDVAVALTSLCDSIEKLDTEKKRIE